MQFTDNKQIRCFYHFVTDNKSPLYIYYTIKSPRESHPRHLNHTIKKSNASHLFRDLQWQTTSTPLAIGFPLFLAMEPTVH